MAVPVLYIHHRAQVSGAARSLAALIEHLDDRWEPHVLTPPGAVVPLFERAGATVTTSPVSLFQHTWDSSYLGRKWLLLGREAAALGPHVVALERLLRSRDFALVHLNDSPLLAAGALAHRKRLPVVWHLRSALSEGGGPLPRVVTRLLDRWGDAAIAIDDDVARSFALRIPTEVVFNTVRLPDAPLPADEARRRLGLPTDRVVIGFIGNVRRVKGWPEFVDSAAQLRDEPVHFVVVGGGVRPPAFFRSPYGRAVKATGLAADDESELARAVAARGLERLFTMLPFTDAVEEVYPALDVVAFPNQGTGLGRPVLEAAAFGKPVVASGSRDGAGVLLPEQTGILLQQATSPALAGALGTLVHDAALRERLGRAAAEHAAANFDPAANAARVAAVYSRLVDRRR